MSKKIRILRVITQAEVVSWHLKNFIDRSEKDYQVYVTGIDVSRFAKEYPSVTFIDNKILRKVSPVYDFLALINLITLCIKIKPRIIHSIMPKAGLLASIAGLLTRVPIRIHTFTGQVWSTKSGLSRKFYQFMDKMILFFSTDCLTDSPSQSKFLFQHGLKNGNHPIAYLGKGSLSGVSLSRFNSEILEHRDILRAELGIHADDFVYTYLARKSVVKGIRELFASFDKINYLPHVKLLFIGPDESEGELTKLYTQYQHLSNSIISLDIVKDHERYLAATDVLCLPSSSEGFGTIVIEAAALGVPTIGFDIVGLSDAIENQHSGILVPAGDVDKFAKAMTELYTDQSKLAQLKQNAQQRAITYFSADAMYTYQNEFYTTLLNQRH